MADSYTTISFGYDNKVFKSKEDMDESLLSVEKLIERDVYNNVRFVFNIPSDVENPEATMNYLKEKFKYNNKIKLEIVHGYIEEKRKQQKEQVKSDNEKYSFIFDKNLELEDKISRFIAIEYDKNIPTSNISNYIYKNLNEISKDFNEYLYNIYANAEEEESVITIDNTIDIKDLNSINYYISINN